MLCYSTEILFKSESDKSKIIKLLELERTLWDEGSKLVYPHKDNLGMRYIHNICYYPLRTLIPEAPSQMIIRIERDLISTYKAIKSNKHNISKAPIKSNLSMRLDKRLYTFRSCNSIKLTTIENRIEVGIKLYPKIEDLFSKYIAKDPLLYSKDNKIYLALSFETPEPKEILNPLSIGVDLGINNLAVTSEGIVYKDKEFLKKMRLVRYNKRMLQSNGSKSARKHLNKLKRKERNCKKNMVHHLANRIIKDTKANVIVIENLKNIKTNTKRNKGFNNKHSQVPYYLIRTILSYKAPLYNKKVVTVSPFNTSKIDFRTKKTDGKRERGRYIGKDNKLLHSDINAACNIAYKSKLPISCNINAIYGQGLVNSPIVYKSYSKE